MQDLKQKVLENLKNKGYHEYQLKELNPIIQATIDATRLALNIDNVVNRRELLLDFADYSESDKTSQTTDECVDNYLDSIK